MAGDLTETVSSRFRESLFRKTKWPSGRHMQSGIVGGCKTLKKWDLPWSGVPQLILTLGK